MRRRVTARWGRWLSALLLLLVCAAIFRGWLTPENVASWLLLISFCS